MAETVIPDRSYEPPAIEERTPIGVPLIGGAVVGSPGPPTVSAEFRHEPEQ